MSLGGYVRILGRGPGRSRDLTQDEAHAAMTLMLSGEAAPEAIGALLMLLRMKGETPDEITGFVSAAQAATPKVEGVSLDWPSYAAGRTRGLPWFLRSAKVIAAEGHPVLLHGWNGKDAKVRQGLDTANIKIAETAEQASDILATNRIVYLPLETANPALFVLLQLRNVLGLRSCTNTVCRMLNPGRAPSVQGVFHPSYRDLQTAAAQRLGWQNMTVIKGGGGEFERNPSKAITAHGLRNGAPFQTHFPALLPETMRLSDGPSADTLDAPDAFASAIIIGTATLARDTLGMTPAKEKAA